MNSARNGALLHIPALPTELEGGSRARGGGQEVLHRLLLGVYHCLMFQKS